jgi:hypothetical protein
MDALGISGEKYSEMAWMGSPAPDGRQSCVGRKENNGTTTQRPAHFPATGEKE